MYGNLIFLVVVVSLSVSTNGQSKGDEGDYSIAKVLASRISKQSFETQFSRGRCPHMFFQLGDECVFFANDGKFHSWKRAANTCARIIGGILNEPSAGNAEQPNMQPTNGARQLVLNTPEKTEILRAYFRDYQQQNFAVRLPFDYNTLQRCRDGQDDKWPQFCSNSQYTSSACFETVSNGPNDICIREVDCNPKYLRLACEFTLPGSTELTNSKFRNCPQVSGRRSRLPKWAWIAIIIGSSLLILVIIGGVLALICKKKGKGKGKATFQKKSYPEPSESLPRKPYSEPRQSPERVIRVPLRRDDPAAKPMLIRNAPNNESDTGYLQPNSSSADNTANA